MSDLASLAPAVSPRLKVNPARVETRGKFLYAGSEKLYLRGVTYGPFRPRPDGSAYHTTNVVAADFAAMRAAGINAVRVYTVPPQWLLDEAARQELRLLVGLPWEQHVAFLDEPGLSRTIERRVRDGVRVCVGHPAVFGYAVGNEIPAPIVRWHGPRRVERFLEPLSRAVKAEDPGAPVTYVSFPTTEYLRLPWVDFVCFNVYLEEPAALAHLLRRLGHPPLPVGLRGGAGGAPLARTHAGVVPPDPRRTRAPRTAVAPLSDQPVPTFRRALGLSFQSRAK